MDNTSRMIALLGRMRREMNGMASDAMRDGGVAYGLNYGVSIPSIRAIARAEGRDHTFAKYLYIQQVRELRLAALHIASPEQVTVAEADFWADGITNTEIAEEAAFALLSHSEALHEIYPLWTASDNDLLVYTALMAASRHKTIAGGKQIINSIADVIEHHPTSLTVARGATALAAAIYDNGQMREGLQTIIASLPQSVSADYLRDEMSWRMDNNVEATASRR